jgi:hypothetical protein
LDWEVGVLEEFVVVKKEREGRVLEKIVGVLEVKIRFKPLVLTEDVFVVVVANISRCYHRRGESKKGLRT